MYQLSFPLLSFVCMLHGQASADDAALGMLEKAARVNGGEFKCPEMVHIVDHLKQLGKEKSLATLREYLLNTRDNSKVHIVCRLLFDNPKGWQSPWLGKPSPDINQDAAMKFPLFPVCLSKGVPFLLVRSYEVDGKVDLASECLDLCKGLSMIAKPYPMVDYEKAALALTESEPFRQLYANTERDGMTEMILRQAMTEKLPKKK